MGSEKSVARRLSEIRPLYFQLLKEYYGEVNPKPHTDDEFWVDYGLIL